jgi:prefoldin subunit 5
MAIGKKEKEQTESFIDSKIKELQNELNEQSQNLQKLTVHIHRIEGALSILNEQKEQEKTD